MDAQATTAIDAASTPPPGAGGGPALSRAGQVRQKLARFYHSPAYAALPIFAMLTVAISVVAAATYFTLAAADRHAIRQEGDILAKTMASFAEQVSRQELPQVFWQEAAERARAGDAAWFAADYAAYNREILGVDANIVLDDRDRPILAARNGLPVDIGLYAAMEPVIRPYVAEVRRAETDPPARTGLIAETKRLADGAVPLIIAARLERIAERPVIVTVSTIVPDQSVAALAGGRPFLLVGLRDIDTDVLAHISRDYGFAGLRWGEADAPGTAARTLTNDFGQPIGVLSWQPELPSLSFLLQMRPVIGASLLVLTVTGLVSFAVVRRMALRLTAERQDADRRREAEERAHHLARHDPLTGLGNRRKLVEAFDARLASPGTGFAVLVIDLDHFKPINDIYGHPIGDQVLQIVAKRLQGTVRSGSVVVRLGGDEFAVLTEPNPGPAGIAALASRIPEIMKRPITLGDLKLSLGASVGVARFPDDARTAEELIQFADTALYSAKEQRGTFQFFDPRLNETLRVKSALALDLRAAIEAGSIVPHFQPVVDLATGAIVGHEMLARWRHPTRGFVSPATFIQIAEDSGLIDQIFWRMLGQACAAYREAGATTSLAVNISPAQVKNPAFAETLFAFLAETGFPPAQLEIEVTESSMIRDIDRARPALIALRDKGVRVSLDDFGTGYSSLLMLRDLPLSKVKIDKSFVAGLAAGTQADTAIVDAVLGMARALGLEVTAEGIETAEALALLRVRGCTYGQGFLFGEACAAPVLALEPGGGTPRAACAGSAACQWFDPASPVCRQRNDLAAEGAATGADRAAA